MTPWDLAKPGTEHAHQRALFAWANCAALYGFGPANHADCYTLKTRDELLLAFKIAGNFYPTGEPTPAPELALLFAIHNQGHGDVIRGGRAKAEGVKPGVPDVMLPVVSVVYSPVTKLCPGLFIELKRPASVGKAQGRESRVQSDFAIQLTAQGYRCVVAVGWQEARDIIVEYLK